MWVISSSNFFSLIPLTRFFCFFVNSRNHLLSASGIDIYLGFSFLISVPKGESEHFCVYFGKMAGPWSRRVEADHTIKGAVGFLCLWGGGGQEEQGRSEKGKERGQHIS